MATVLSLNLSILFTLSELTNSNISVIMFNSIVSDYSEDLESSRERKVASQANLELTPSLDHRLQERAVPLQEDNPHHRQHDHSVSG